MPSKRPSSLLQNIAQAVAVALILGIGSAAFSTYLEVRDLRGKLDWLFQHEFPEVKR